MTGVTTQQPERWVFVAGHHKSGTTLLHSLLRQHPMISGFENTGVPADEGQHLQTAYKPASAFGGPGRYIFDPRSHMDETHPLAIPETADHLLREWGQHYDPARPIFLEKSPPNLIRTRFLQHLFPSSLFLVTMRHPLAVAYATQKVCDAALDSLIAHTLLGYDRFMADRQRLRHCHLVRYEDFVSNYRGEMSKIERWLGIACHDYSYPSIDNKDHVYFSMWESDKRKLPMKQVKYIETNGEERANLLGYSFQPDQHYQPVLKSG